MTGTGVYAAAGELYADSGVYRCWCMLLVNAAAGELYAAAVNLYQGVCFFCLCADVCWCHHMLAFFMLETSHFFCLVLVLSAAD